MRAQTLSRWITQLELSTVAPEAIERARGCLLDFLGVALAGAAEEESARIALEYARSQAGPPQAALPFSPGILVGSESAAFAYGVCGHSIEMDDVHNASSLHPGAVSIPAALAVAQEVNATGAALLEAILAAYEIALRVGEAARPSAVYARGFHPTAVCGPFSSAAAAGKLMGLTEDQMAHALGLAWSFAAGNMSFQAEGSWAKRIQVGNSVRCGVQAARLARLGATGPKHVFEDHGFFHGYGATPDEAKLLGGLGGPLKVMEVGIKPYACCRYNQTPIDVLLQLRRDVKLDASKIERLDVDIASTGHPLVAIPAWEKQSPRGTVEAQFSLYYSCAVALLAGSAGREEYREPWLSDARVRELARKVHAGSSPEIDGLFPEKWPARVCIRMESGEIHERFAEYCLGDPEMPLSHDDLAAKFESLTRGAFSDRSRRSVIEAVEGLDRAPSLADLLGPLFNSPR